MKWIPIFLLIFESAFGAVIINPYRFTASGTYSDELNWKTNILASGSLVSDSTLTAASNFCVSAKANGYWTKLIIVCPVAGSNLLASTHYLKYPAATVKATENGTAMTYNETGASGGVVGDGTSGYWNTGYNPSTAGASLSSFSLWAWTHTTTSGGTKVTIGNGGTAGVNSTLLGWIESGTRESGVIGGTTGVDAPQGTATSSTGLMGVNTSGSRSCQFWKNGISTGTPFTQTDVFYNSNLFFACLNAVGSPLVFSARRNSFWIIATGLTSTDISNMYTDVLAFQTALTRN